MVSQETALTPLGSFVCETGLGKERDSKLRGGEYQLGAPADLSGGATGCR